MLYIGTDFAEVSERLLPADSALSPPQQKPAKSCLSLLNSLHAEELKKTLHVSGIGGKHSNYYGTHKMRLRSRLTPLIFTATILIALGGLYTAEHMAPNTLVDSPGFCSSKGGGFSDEQFIAATLQAIREDMARTGFLVHPDGSREPITLANTIYRDWTINEKTCCFVDRRETNGLLARISKSQIITVWVKQFDDTHPVKYSDSKFHIKYSVCGAAIDSDLNISKKQLNRVKLDPDL